MSVALLRMPAVVAQVQFLPYMEMVSACLPQT
jgi:hypothetical protein